MFVGLLKSATKLTLRFMPGWLDRSMSRVLAHYGFASQAYLAHSLLNRPRQIVAGPFAGIKYLPVACGSALFPKIAGTYEKELFETFSRLDARPPAVVINVGCGEGYYAVSLARRWQGLRVIALDIDPRARKYCRKLAQKNHLQNHIDCPDQIDFKKILNNTFEDQTEVLILIDCEGAEQHYLDLARIPVLKYCKILVETHDIFVPGITEQLKEHFKQTHKITEIQATPRTLDDFPANLSREKLTNEQALAYLNEGRDPSQRWLFLEPS